MGHCSDQNLLQRQTLKPESVTSLLDFMVGKFFSRVTIFFYINFKEKW